MLLLLLSSCSRPHRKLHDDASRFSPWPAAGEEQGQEPHPTLERKLQAMSEGEERAHSLSFDSSNRPKLAMKENPLGTRPRRASSSTSFKPTVHQ